MGEVMDNPAERVLDVLRLRGWSKGESFGPNGQRCVGAACEIPGGMSEPVTLIARIINEHYADRTVEHICNTSMATIVSFNDHPDTTFADVERVLEKAAVKWEEERVLRND